VKSEERRTKSLESKTAASREPRAKEEASVGDVFPSERVTEGLFAIEKQW
jgi:hypothetical protein